MFIESALRDIIIVYTANGKKQSGKTEKKMDILMTILKIIFVLMLCVPIFFVAKSLITQLIDEFVKQQKRKKDNR